MTDLRLPAPLAESFVPDASAPALYAVAPRSLSSWFSYFVDQIAGDEIVYLGEEPTSQVASLAAALGRYPQPTVVFFSSHETLARDWRLGQRLRSAGKTVHCQSQTCGLLGTDKVLMKEFFDRNGYQSPPWTRPGGRALPGSAAALVVVKNRNGTQAIGTRLARRGGCVLAADELCEIYLDGIEYSVLTYRDEHGIATFPPVWKGATSTELVPPWRRLRLCPAPTLTPTTEYRLRGLSRRLAWTADALGYMEIEYLVTPDGDVHVLEVNPRVSGTMRVAAMATGVMIFAMHRRPDLRVSLRAVRCAGEMPYEGPPIADPHAGVFATSRITVAGGTFAEVHQKLKACSSHVGQIS